MSPTGEPAGDMLASAELSRVETADQQRAGQQSRTTDQQRRDSYPSAQLRPGMLWSFILFRYSLILAIGSVGGALSRVAQRSAEPTRRRSALDNVTPTVAIIKGSGHSGSGYNVGLAAFGQSRVVASCFAPISSLSQRLPASRQGRSCVAPLRGGFAIFDPVTATARELRIGTEQERLNNPECPGPAVSRPRARSRCGSSRAAGLGSVPFGFLP